MGNTVLNKDNTKLEKIFIYLTDETIRNIKEIDVKAGIFNSLKKEILVKTNNRIITYYNYNTKTTTEIKNIVINELAKEKKTRHIY